MPGYVAYGTNVYLRQVAVALDDPTRFRMTALQGFEAYAAEFRLGDTFPSTDGGQWNLQKDPAYPAGTPGGVGVPDRVWAVKLGGVATTKTPGVIKGSASVQIASDGTATVAPGVGLGTVTQVTADPATPLSVVNTNTTPMITMPVVSRTQSGWLSAADYALIMDTISGVLGGVTIHGGTAAAPFTDTMGSGSPSSTETTHYIGGTP